MHFGEAAQFKAQKLIVVIYKDRYITTGKPDEIFIKVESIQEARYVGTYEMCKLHFAPEFIFKDIIDKLEDDIFYRVELKHEGWSWKVKNFKKVTSRMIKNNPLLGLH